MMVDRIFVRETGDILGYEVSQVDDPAGLAAVEPGWREYVAAAEVERLRTLGDAMAKAAREFLHGRKHSGSVLLAIKAWEAKD